MQPGSLGEKRSGGDDGYTLAEMLTALVILGLTMAGLIEGMNIIHHIQASATSRLAQATSQGAAERRLGQLFQDQGPFQSDDSPGLTGDSKAFRFPCRGGASCGANLQADKAKPALMIFAERNRPNTIGLGDFRNPRFVYIDQTSQLSQWPPTGERARQPLRAVLIIAGDDREPQIIATARLWLEQSADCADGSILGSCQAHAP